MAEHETIADIIAEKRRQADEIERDVAEKMKRNAMISDRYARELVADIRREADRLEAAHKRELSKNGADFGQLGDAAKLREALAYLFTLIDMRKLVLDCDETEEISAVQVMLDECRAALSAPPRNCDLTKVAEDPWRAWLDDKSNWDELGNPKLEIHDWLVAPATEGETDGNE